MARIHLVECDYCEAQEDLDAQGRAPRAWVTFTEGNETLDFCSQQHMVEYISDKLASDVDEDDDSED